jgi:transcriptional regulator with XRE-family HTH domain
MGFATKFRELRLKRGLSTAAADEVFGLMRGTVSNWENGFSEP